MKQFSFLLSFLLCSFFCGAQSPAKPAGEILATAYKQAAAGNKNVILIFHASWCGWCHKMDNSMNDASCAAFFTENYVTVHLTVDETDPVKKKMENPGADEVRKKFNGDKAGLPFWVILDKNGKLLADSYIRKPNTPADVAGDNIGCPASEEEVAAFIDILKKTSKMNDGQLQIVTARFKKNKAN